MTPSPLVFLFLALAALRTYQLAARDSFPPLVWARTKAVGAHYDAEAAAYWYDRPLLAEWLDCAWCSGLWWAAGWYGAWLAWPHGSLYAAVPLALSAALACVRSALPD